MARAPTLLAVLALALVPTAGANQPPVAVPDVQATAVLHEPVLFRHASHDADGVITRVEWHFDDGRTVVAPTVTRAFDWPGRRGVALAVTDDDGATTTVSFEVLVHATRLHGRAVAVHAAGATTADTGDQSTTSHDTFVASTADARQGGLYVAGAWSELRTLDERALATADVGHIHIPIPIGFIHATGVEAESFVACTWTSQTARFTQLRLNDAPLVPPGQVPPNTRLALPGGVELVLNTQDLPAPDRRGVTALRVLVDGANVAEVARAEAGVTHCPWA